LLLLISLDIFSLLCSETFEELPNFCLNFRDIFFPPTVGGCAAVIVTGLLLT
jgi:hypothetical protein